MESEAKVVCSIGAGAGFAGDKGNVLDLTPVARDDAAYASLHPGPRWQKAAIWLSLDLDIGTGG